MNRRTRIVLIVTLALIAGTAGAVSWFKSHKRLGRPGIKATPTPGSLVMQIDLPERVLDFTSTNLPQEEIVLGYLPKDTSYARRRYTAPDGLTADANIILMGADRTSIHKAEYCLAGSGFHRDEAAVATIPIGGATPYALEVAKWTVTRIVDLPNGQKRKDHGLYIFWFVADGTSTPSYFRYKVQLMWDVLTTGVLQRWAYVNYFFPCDSGQEDATFERAKKLIAASVPEFQLPPESARAAAVAEH